MDQRESFIDTHADTGQVERLMDAQDRETLLFIADRALFGSKGRGRDRIMLARDLVAESEERHSPGQLA